MAAKASINDELLLIIGLRELEEKDLGGEVVDVGQSQSYQMLLELMGDDLRGMSQQLASHSKSSARPTLTSRDEKRCFILDCAS